MNEQTARIANEIRRLLAEGYAGVLGLRRHLGHVGPHLFTREQELGELVLEPRYPMAQALKVLLAAKPDLRLGVVARGCDVRALKALAEAGVAPQGLAFVGVVCSPEQAAECNCEQPIYDVTKCTGCWECVENCPQEAITIQSCCPIVLPNAYDEGLAYRRAIYVPYVQAVPRVYLRDPEHCLKLTDRLDCKGCTNICQAKAVLDDDEPKTEQIEVGAILVAPGSKPFDPDRKFELGHSRSPNIVSSMEFERLLSASGPYHGHVVRPGDEQPIRKVAFVQCVGSRDKLCGNEYCSSVCCMYAVKEAVIAKEHVRTIEPTIFYMDIRAHGKDFDRYVERAKNEYGVVFKRSRVAGAEERPDGQVVVSYESEDGRFEQEPFDLVVLSVGLEPGADFPALASQLEIERNEYGFFATDDLAPFDSTRPGIFVCGAAAGPKDIPETVVQAAGAVARAGALLGERRGTLTQTKTYPPEKDTTHEGPRIGVFVCHCGINIGGIVDVPSVVEYTRTLPNVTYAEDNLYTCSQDTQEKIKSIIDEQGINRVIVASCSPRTHEPLFQETIREAGINPHLFEMANIRDQCSWVHMNDPVAATAKAKDLVRMAVAKVRDAVPLRTVLLDVNHDALVVGGGLAGMTSALALAEQGFNVALVEKEKALGGNLRHIDRDTAGHDVGEYLRRLTQRVRREKRIRLFTNAALAEVEGFIGNYESTIAVRNGKRTRLKKLKHGAAVLATGAQESVPTEYGYGRYKNVITQQELEKKFQSGSFKPPRAVAMIQCVGSREDAHPYCSRICCTKAVKNAIRIRKLRPETEVYILYRDIRTYGFREKLYNEARELGVQFLRYVPERKPSVRKQGRRLQLSVHDTLLDRPVQIDTDLVVLSARIDPNPDTARLAPMFKVSANADGFFLEAHAKLRPVDFATEGLFVCGLAHYPKDITETVAQALAASARAATILSKDKIESEARISVVREERCSGCGACVTVCAYKAIELDPEKGVAHVNEAVCKGCGACAATCRAAAIDLKGFRDDQILSVLNTVSAW